MGKWVVSGLNYVSFILVDVVQKESVVFTSPFSGHKFMPDQWNFGLIKKLLAPHNQLA